MNQQIETRFVELMTELFQLDEAEALDFGLYRVIRRHNREVKAFLGEIVTAQETKLLRDGKLATILDKAFALQDNETKAEDKFRLKDLEQQLGLKPGMTKEQREAALAQAEGFPALKDLVAEYRSRTETLVTQQTVQQDRAEVLNRLYQFFSRHYQDGDFIVERRYSKGGARYIKSTGEDTEFHWATEDMYYIKSGDIFTDWPVRLSNGQRVTFTVEPESLQNTRAALKPSDKAHYELDEATKDGDSIKVSLKYLKGAQTEKQKDEIVAAVQTKVGGDSADIKRWLNRFIARNQSDFFIHKRLKEALTEDLDIFIKTEVLTIDQLLAGGDLPKRAMKVARIMREVGGHIIDFLAALEDFQKALWEKKKLVFETRYVITLDRLERYCPKWLIQNVDTIVEKQRREWQELGLGEYSDSTGCIRKSGGDLVTPAAEHYLPLPVDTRNFDADFKWSMLAAVTAETALDDVLDGLAIHSDNWQALKTLQEKYRERVKCIYIDPPYNTGGDGFPYKDAYPHSSWMAMIVNRLQAGVPFMHPIGALFASIDANERRSLEIALDISLGRKNRVEEIIWAQNTTKNQSPTYSNNHEYVEVYARSLDAVKRDERMFREPKPGASEILDLVEKLNPKFPSVAQIEREIAALFSRHREEFRAELEDLGIEYDKSLDPWKRLYNYTHAEYRDECGRYVSEAEASTKQARIWVWREDNPSMPNVSAGSQKESVRDPKDPNYRFYRPEHPVSHEPCPAPKRGWVWPEKPLTGFSGSFSELAADNRIVWGDRNPKRPKVPQVKKFLHEMDTQVSKSVVLDYTDGEKELTHLTGKTRSFPNPKPTTLVARFIGQTTDSDDWVMDFFAGSGTTLHAAQIMQHDDRQRRRVLLIEGGRHFENILVPRVKRCAAAWIWKNGSPASLTGPGLFMRIQELEQYNDTLVSLDVELDEGDVGDLFQDPAFALRYRLDKTLRTLYCNVNRFGSPFGYQLKRAEGGGEATPREVDLVESLPYLIGMDISRLYREPLGVVMLGRNRRGQSVAVFFRDCAAEGSAKWLSEKLAKHPADRVYTNDPAGLTFDGCDRLEAIEAVFALQFGRP